jgi:hypothetical protein
MDVPVTAQLFTTSVMERPSPVRYQCHDKAKPSPRPGWAALLVGPSISIIIGPDSKSVVISSKKKKIIVTESEADRRECHQIESLVSGF